MLNSDLYRRIFRYTKAQAGPRYTPGIKGYENFPSIRVDELFDAFEGISRSKSFWSSLEKLEAEFIKKDIPQPLDDKRITDEIALLHSQFLVAFRSFKANRGDLASKIDFAPMREIGEKIKSLTNEFSNSLYEKKKIIVEELKAKKSMELENEETRKLDALENRARDYMYGLQKISNFSQRTSAILANFPYMLLLGAAGQGKTHFLCDIAEMKIGEKQPVLIFQSSNLSYSQQDIWENIIASFRLRCSKKSLFSFLAKEARKKKVRALVIVDAINEGDRKLWRNSLERFLNDVKPYPEIGIILSCRIPFQDTIVKKRAKSIFHSIYHPGFEDRETEAQLKFFKWYKIPAPEIPLFHTVFSNPLFLKIFCETLKEVVQQKHRKIKDISSGIEGITNIFEDYVITKQRKINKDTSRIFTRPDWLWANNDGVIKESALLMAGREDDYILSQEFDAILKKYLIDRRHIRIIRNKLIDETVFNETIKWINNKPIEALQFSYQRLSDYLIVRSVLSRVDVKKVFNARRLIKKWNDSPNLLEALFLEFPNRTSKELFDVFPGKSIPYSAIDAFVQGFYWRGGNCFTGKTGRYITWILDTNRKDAMLEALFALACKPKHKYNAITLSNFLKKKNLPERDLFWTEFLRSQDQSSPVYRLLEWIGGQNIKNIGVEFAQNYIELIQWLLASINRNLRDNATHKLVVLGESFPKELFEVVKRSVEIDDIYIKERMIAALYGTAMRSIRHEDFIKNHLSEWAKWVFNTFFDSKSRYSSAHILIHEYAIGIIELAFVNKKISRDRMTLARRRPKLISSISSGTYWEEDKKAQESKNPSQPRQFFYPYVHMDSGIYVLGRIAGEPSSSRSHTLTLARIVWKMKQLGWTDKRFGDIDKKIEERNWNNHTPRKIDRYGKKYFWIAFYELAGFYKHYLPNMDTIDAREASLRGRHRDIDPSFPEFTLESRMINQNLLKAPRDMAQWMVGKPMYALDKVTMIRRRIGFNKGEWILLSGFYSQTDEKKKRMIDLSWRGFFIRNQDVKEFLSLKNQTLKHREEFLPATPEVREAFAGEIPWIHFIPKSNSKMNLYIRNRKKRYMNISISFFDKIESKVDEKSSKKSFRMIEVPVYKVLRVELPVLHFGKEEDVVREGISLEIPSVNISRFLRLLPRDNFLFYDSKGKLAAYTVHYGRPYKRYQQFTFIRKDILEQYLKMTRQRMFWHKKEWRNPYDIPHEKFQKILNKRANHKNYLISYDAE